MTSRAVRLRGFSLIELMVAMAISMVAVIALTESWIATRQTYRVQSMQARLTEDGRFALSMLQRVISQAGFRPSSATVIPDSRVAIDPDNGGIRVRFIADGSNQIACDGAVAADVDQTLVIRKNGAKLVCGTVGAATVTEWLAPAAAGTGNGSEVADFSILYGVDTGPANSSAIYGCGTELGGAKPRDCVADDFVSALASGQSTEQIVAVRACLILRSENTDGSLVKLAAAKNCAGNDITDSAGDRRLYRAFRSTILLKNR